MPFFSIILPTYNRSSLLPRAIDSVLQQTFSDFELIVVDDGSTDATQQLVSNYADNRVRYVYQENKGVCVARNHGVAVANAPYLVFLDSDDYATEHWLKDFHDGFMHNATDFVFCDMKRVNLKNGSVQVIQATHPYNDQPSNHGFFMPGTFAVKKTLFESLGGFDRSIKYGEFTELMFRFMQIGFTKCYTGHIGLVYEASLDGGSKNLENKINSCLYILAKHPHYFQTNRHVLRLYYQNIGVAHARLSNWNDSKRYLWKAFLVQPWKLKTLARWVICFFPKLSQRIWN